MQQSPLAWPGGKFSYAPLIGSDGQLERVRARLTLQALMLVYQANGTWQRGKKRARRS
jgi:hypothetical protein